MTTTTKAPRKRTPRPTPQSWESGNVQAVAENASNVVQPAAPLRVCLNPFADGEDKGDGGVGRVIRAQQEWLPRFGIEVVRDPEQADVIASHIFFPGVRSVADKEPDIWLKQYPAAAFVLHCHGMYWAEHEWPKWAHEANRGVMESIRVADAVTSPTEWVRMIIARHTSRRAVVIPHGVDLEEWAGGTNGGYVWWDKTRPDPVCDPTPMQEVSELLPATKFKSTYGRATSTIDIVGLLPYADAAALTRNAGVYLATSQETFGIATLQAMAAGVPVAGYAWGGQAEFVRHGTDGLLVRPGDVPDLARAIEMCFESRERMGANAREQASKFTWEAACAQYADLYRRTWAERHPSPKTSVVITAYNLADYLPEALDSVVTQGGDWECIVVDDCSPDDTAVRFQEVVSKLQPGMKERFRYLRTPKNLGQAGARNHGIKHARGRYIMPLDADDQLAPSALPTLEGALETDRRLSVAYGKLYWVDEAGEPIDYGSGPGVSPWPPATFNTALQLNAATRERPGAGGNQLPYCSMFKRAAWDAVGGIRRRLKTGEDADFWTRLASYGWRMERVTEAPVVIYRVRAGSLSQSQPTPDWGRWYPWRSSPERSPAGLLGDYQLPIPSLTPPAISVVIPVGPGHEYLLMDALDSVEAQSMTWWEIVVVNDTGTPFDFPLPPWVRVLETPGRIGPAAARNLGIAATTAKLFVPLDADDMLEPHALDVFWRHGQERPGVVLYSDFWEDRDGVWKPYRLGDWDCDRLIKQPMGINVRLVPKEAWAKVGGYNEDMFGWEDWDFEMRLAEAGICCARIAEPLFSYRRGTGTVSEQAYDRRQHLLDKFMLPRWGKYRDGKEKLMACGCSSGSTATIFTPASQAAMGVPGGGGDGMTLLVYEGPQGASFTLRGPSGTVYEIGPGEPRYVFDADLSWFLEVREGFSKLNPANIEMPAGGEPILQSQLEVPVG